MTDKDDQMDPVTPIYIGSQTLIEHDGTWHVEHRNPKGELTKDEIIGGLLDLNFHLLGIPRVVDRTA